VAPGAFVVGETADLVPGLLSGSGSSDDDMRDGIGQIEEKMIKGLMLQDVVFSKSQSLVAGLEGGLKVYRFVFLDRHVA
jgi:hypothetical protein